jgi:hypothetical protein
VKVDLEGFQSFVADDLLIDPGTVRRLDVRLQLGTASAEVNVVAGAAVIQTDTGEITAQVEHKQFDDVPLVDVLSLTSSAAHNDTGHSRKRLGGRHVRNLRPKQADVGSGWRGQ